MIVEFGANPVPSPVTLLPTVPFAGLSTRLEFTVNDAVTVLTPSDAETIASPLGVAGTLKEQAVLVFPGKLPFDAVEQVEFTAFPVNVNDIVEFAANPAPVAVTLLPTIPLVGDRDKPGVRGCAPAATGPDARLSP
jgi:hypothetical protein